MSFQTFFSFSSGLAGPLLAPSGTKQRILDHISRIEHVLPLKRSVYKGNPEHWDHFDPEFRAGFPSVDDEVLCTAVEGHNTWVQLIYEQFALWAKEPVADGETITPEDAREFWHGFQMLEVAPNRWTTEYYRARMEELYEVMRGRPAAGIYFDEKILSPKQAGAVIRLFEQFLDPGDLRLEVPKGHDYLASSYNGEYTWCEKCGAIADQDVGDCRKRKCPIREEEE